jgi:hypothetical protein
MQNQSFKNPFVQKMKLLTHLLVLSIGVNVAFGGTLVYNFAIKDKEIFTVNTLPEVAIRREHSALLQSFFQMSFDELVLELSSRVEISDGYKICDLALAILSTYHYLDLSKALMGEMLEEREVMFIHADGGERFPLCLYPDVKEYHYALIKGYVKESKYPFTAEGLFSELKITKEKSPTDLVAAFMLSKEYIAIYTFVSRFFPDLAKEKLLLLLIDGSYKDIERFYYLYLENMDKPREMIRYFLQNYTRLNSKYAAEMWLEIDQEFILRQLDNEEITAILKLTNNESFLTKVNESLRGNEVRKFAEQKLPIEEEKAAVKPENPDEKYTVQTGDSLWKIAHRHKISIKTLKSHNDLQTDVLKPGQMLIIPK